MHDQRLRGQITAARHHQREQLAKRAREEQRRLDDQAEREAEARRIIAAGSRPGTLERLDAQRAEREAADHLPRLSHRRATATGIRRALNLPGEH